MSRASVKLSRRVSYGGSLESRSRDSKVTHDRHGLDAESDSELEARKYTVIGKRQRSFKLLETSESCKKSHLSNNGGTSSQREILDQGDSAYKSAPFYERGSSGEKDISNRSDTNNQEEPSICEFWQKDKNPSNPGIFSDSSKSIKSMALTGGAGRWSSKWIPRSLSLVLPNKGSVARDHLANERTYLAWTRTALVMMTLGLAFLQLYSIQTRAHEAVYKDKTYAMSVPQGVDALHLLGKPFGVLVGVFAMITVAFGYYRYVAVQQGLRNAEFPASRFIISAVLLMSLLSMALILAIDIKSL